MRSLVLVRKGSRCDSGGAETVSEKVIFIQMLYGAKPLLKESRHNFSAGVTLKGPC